MNKGENLIKLFPLILLGPFMLDLHDTNMHVAQFQKSSIRAAMEQTQRADLWTR